MSPESRLTSRQETWFGRLFDLFASRNGPGRVFASGNVQVRLRPGLRRNSDVIFFEKSRSHLIRETHIEGAFAVLVEFVSPESAIGDWHALSIEYEAADVPEYWIIDRQQLRVAVDSVGEGRRYHPIAPQAGKIHSVAVPDFWIKLEWLRQGLEFDTSAIAEEMGMVA